MFLQKREACAYAQHFGNFYRNVKGHYLHAISLTRPLYWHDPVTGWILQLPDETCSPNMNSHEIIRWARLTSRLQVVGYRGSVPQGACDVPLGLKLPPDQVGLAIELYPARYQVEQAFGIHSTRHILRNEVRQLQPWISPHPMGFSIYKWTLRWHPAYGFPLLPLGDVPCLYMDYPNSKCPVCTAPF